MVEWAKTLDLPEILADAIPRKQGVDALRVVSELTEEEIEKVIGALHDGLRNVLRKSVNEMRMAFMASDLRIKSSTTEVASGSKFNLIPLSCGSIEDFHLGLERRIGMWASISAICFLENSRVLQNLQFVS
jgi:hypothetical protein